MVPERPDLLGAEAVHVTLARQDGVLRDAGHPVLGVRDVDPVPMDRHALVDVLVQQGYLDEISLAHAQLRPGRAAVEGQGVDRAARRELDRRPLRGEREAGIGHSVERAVHIGDADTVAAADQRDRG